MKKAFLYLSLSCLVVSCIKDKPAPPELPATPAVVEVPETPPAPEADSIPEPPPVPEVIKKTPPPVKKKVVTKKREDYKSLIFNVQLGINPGKKNWVLFKNGTYLVFPNNTAEKDAVRAAKKILSAHDGDIIFVEKSNFAKGWIASTPTGIYNYIERGAFGRRAPKSSRIEKKGIKNIAADKKELEIIHINNQ
ncbi:hypothetical protein [Dokdonia sp.]|uniref:hypothetical protein n=1 Tax=Dokdonia sp. TaxID=2024995 RepID=UPI003262F669